MFSKPVTVTDRTSNPGRINQIQVYNEPQPIKALPPPSIYPLRWNPMPNPELFIPPGLDYLRQIDTLIINEQPNFFQMMTGWDANNQYQLTNQDGQQLYYAYENSPFCERAYCGAKRGFMINIYDNYNNEVIRITREFKICAGNCWFASCSECCAFEVQVEAPVGHIIGFVRQRGSCWRARFEATDGHKKEYVKIKGPCCAFQDLPCVYDNEFVIYTSDHGTPIGRIRKKWSGLEPQRYTNAETFGITFPIDLAVRAKVTLIAACYLIDFMFYEKSRKQARVVSD